MNCRDMDALLFTGAPLPPEAQEHLAGCAHCRALAGALGDDVAYEVDPAVLRQAAAHVSGSVPAVRPLASRGAYATLFLGLAGALASGFAIWKGVLGLPAMSGMQAGVVFALLLSLLLVTAFALAGAMRPGARTVRGGILFAAGLVAIESVFWTLFPDHETGGFVHQGMVCFTFGMSCSILAAILAWFAVRRGYLVAPVSTGALIGALSGLAGLAALELHCPVLLSPHLAVWHAAVFAVSAGVGGAVPLVRAKLAEKSGSPGGYAGQ